MVPVALFPNCDAKVGKKIIYPKNIGLFLMLFFNHMPKDPKNQGDARLEIFINNGI